MATITLTVCDECGREAKRLIRIGNSNYCGRDCYLTMCKRVFDSHWMQALKGSQFEAIAPKKKPDFTRVA